MHLGRRIKRAEQAEARQNAAFGGATTLRDDPPAPFEEDFGVAFAATFASLRLTSTRRPRLTTTSLYPRTSLPGCQ